MFDDIISNGRMTISKEKFEKILPLLLLYCIDDLSTDTNCQYYEKENTEKICSECWRNFLINE